ncbi:MAG: sulfotransferase [Gemmatimonadota bacterium]
MSLAWRLDRTVRNARSRIVKHLYQDHAGGPEQAILVAGMARSGTTWLAEMLVSHLHARLMFEPFHHRSVGAYGAFEYVQYMRPGEPSPELHDLVSAVLSGGLRDALWVDRMVSVLRPEARIVKAVRACLMLRWIHDRFPRTPVLLVVRHPCAVAASFAGLGWSARPDLDSIRRQPELLNDHLADVSDILEREWQPHEETAILWCVNHRVALRQSRASAVMRVHYESLVADPEGEMSRILRTMGRESHGFEGAAVRRPSRTTRLDAAKAAGGTDAAGWMRLLDPSQVADSQTIVQAFELDGLYDDSGRPTGGLYEDA